jgi:hypothetical protein
MSTYSRLLTEHELFAWCSHDLPLTEGDIGQTYRLPFVKASSTP